MYSRLLVLLAVPVQPQALSALSIEKAVRSTEPISAGESKTMRPTIMLLICGLVGLSYQDPLYPSESDPNFIKMFEKKYATLVNLDQNRCLQKLTCILAKNESSFEDPVIANIVKDFEAIKTIHTNSPAFPFLAAYQTGLSKQKCDKAYPECPIGFVADERQLDDDDEEIAGVIETETAKTEESW